MDPTFTIVPFDRRRSGNQASVTLNMPCALILRVRSRGWTPRPRYQRRPRTTIPALLTSRSTIDLPSASSQRSRGGGIGHVEGERPCTAPGNSDFAGSVCRRLRINVGDDHGSASLCEPLYDCRTIAATCTRNQREATIENAWRHVFIDLQRTLLVMTVGQGASPVWRALPNVRCAIVYDRYSGQRRGRPR